MNINSIDIKVCFEEICQRIILMSQLLILSAVVTYVCNNACWAGLKTQSWIRDVDPGI